MATAISGPWGVALLRCGIKCYGSDGRAGWPQTLAFPIPIDPTREVTVYRILVSDPLQASGIAAMRAAGHEVVELPAEDKPRLAEIIPDFDALVVRSGTTVTADLLAAGRRLKVVGRAGIGVDNVDLKAATDRGILVVNAPTANLMSATEHTFALLLSLMRKVPEADQALKNGIWDRKRFVGAELQGKTLGIIGFGRIGQRVAKRAQAFDMTVIAFDPHLDAEVIRRHDAEPLSLDDVLARADAVTLHVPLADGTRNLIDAERLAGMKEGAVLINCARGGVVDETALLAALENGPLAGAGVDVFATETLDDFTLAAHPKVVATPHVGAQTREAQLRIANDTARMVVSALEGSLAVTAVNLPFRPAGNAGTPFMKLAESLGQLAGGLLPGGVRELRVGLWGVDDALHIPVTIAAIKGALTKAIGTSINYVNAERVAAGRGIEVVRAVHSAPADYPMLISVSLVGKEQQIEVVGTLVHEGASRVVRIDDHQLEFRPSNHLLVVRNQDVPGVVGRLGTVLGEAGVNIAEIHLSRVAESDEALSVVRLDQRPDDAVLDALRALDPVRRVELVSVS